MSKALLAADTDIITSRGVQTIKDIESNPLIVLTHEGRWRRAEIRREEMTSLYPIVVRKPFVYSQKIWVTSDYCWMDSQSGEAIRDLPHRNNITLLPSPIISISFDYNKSNSTLNRLWYTAGLLFRLSYNKFYETPPLYYVSDSDNIKSFIQGFINISMETQHQRSKHLFSDFIDVSNATHTKFILNAFPSYGFYIYKVIEFDDKTRIFYGCGNHREFPWSIDFTYFGNPLDKKTAKEAVSIVVDEDHSFVLSSGVVMLDSVS